MLDISAVGMIRVRMCCVNMIASEVKDVENCRSPGYTPPSGQHLAFLTTETMQEPTEGLPADPNPSRSTLTICDRFIETVQNNIFPITLSALPLTASHSRLTRSMDQWHYHPSHLLMHEVSPDSCEPSGSSRACSFKDRS